MMKTVALIVFFYVLVLLQTSFLVHFKAVFWWWLATGLILIIVILVNFFENPRRNSGIISAFFAGFFLDIFSENFFGFWTSILLITALFIKFVLKKYVRIPTFKGT